MSYVQKMCNYTMEIYISVTSGFCKLSVQVKGVFFFSFHFYSVFDTGWLKARSHDEAMIASAKHLSQQ